MKNKIIVILKASSLLVLVAGIGSMFVYPNLDDSFSTFLRLISIFTFGYIFFLTFLSKDNTIKGFRQALSRFMLWYFLGVATTGLLSFVFIPKALLNQHVSRNIDNESNVSVSTSKKYYIRSISDTGYLEMVTPGWSRAVATTPSIEKYSHFDKSNVAWGTNEEIVVITYVSKDIKNNSRVGIMRILSTSDRYSDETIDLGTGAYYGVSKDQAFPPKISPDGKYIAVQNDLIHAISIYDIKGKLIVKHPTAFKNTKLFSPEMYKLDSGTYSPFLEYEWSSDSKSIKYMFNGGKTTYVLNLSEYLND